MEPSKEKRNSFCKASEPHKIKAFNALADKKRPQILEQKDKMRKRRLSDVTSTNKKRRRLNLSNKRWQANTQADPIQLQQNNKKKPAVIDLTSNEQTNFELQSMKNRKRMDEIDLTSGEETDFETNNHSKKRTEEIQSMTKDDQEAELIDLSSDEETENSSNNQKQTFVDSGPTHSQKQTEILIDDERS